MYAFMHSCVRLGRITIEVWRRPRYIGHRDGIRMPRNKRGTGVVDEVDRGGSGVVGRERLRKGEGLEEVNKTDGAITIVMPTLQQAHTNVRFKSSTN